MRVISARRFVAGSAHRLFMRIPGWCSCHSRSLTGMISDGGLFVVVMGAPPSVLGDREGLLRAAADGLLDPGPHRRGRSLLLETQVVVVAHLEHFRHEPHAHRVALAEVAVHRHPHVRFLHPAGVDLTGVSLVAYSDGQPPLGAVRGRTPRAVARVEASVRQRAREIVDAIAPKGEVEFASEVAAVLPVAVICDMLGVPEADRPRLLDLTNRLLAGGDAEYGGTKESLRQAGQELREYGLWLGKSRLADPQDDITTTLVHAEVDGDALPPEDLGPFILLLIAAGNETTRTAISHGLLTLTEFPDERRRWLEDLDGRAVTAAEEIVRWATPVMHMRRTVTRDTEFAGVRMRKGDKIAMWYIAANRDEAAFTDPYRFDITREPNHQGGFGTGGAHFCLGAHLARREIIVMMTELLRRLPDIEATGKPDKLRSNFIHGIKRLPAAFTPVA